MKRASIFFLLSALFAFLITSCDKAPTVKADKGTSVAAYFPVKNFPAIMPEVLCVPEPFDSYPVIFKIGKETQRVICFRGFTYRDQLKV